MAAAPGLLRVDRDALDNVVADDAGMSQRVILKTIVDADPVGVTGQSDTPDHVAYAARRPIDRGRCIQSLE